MKTATLPFVTRVVLFALCLILYNEPIAAQITDQVNALREAVVRTGDQLENSKAQTERFLKESRINEGPCTNLYGPFTPDQYLVSSTVLPIYLELRQRFDVLARTLQPILDIDRETKAQRDELHRVEGALERQKRQIADEDSQIEVRGARIASLENILKQKEGQLERLDKGQVAAIRGWLLDKYPNETVHRDTADRRIIVTTTLFGAFVTDYPAALQPRAVAEINVIFAPAIFQEDLWPNNVSVGIQGYSSDIVRYIDANATFELGSAIPIKGLQPLHWTWTVRSPEDFAGISFSITALIRRISNEDRVNKDLLVTLPIKITSLPRPMPWWALTFSGVAGGALAAEIGRYGVRTLKDKFKKKETLVIRPDE